MEKLIVPGVLTSASCTMGPNNLFSFDFAVKVSFSNKLNAF